MYWKHNVKEVPASVQDAQLSGNHFFYNTDGSPPVRLTPEAVISALTIRGQNRTINNMHAERTMIGGTGE